MIIAIDGPAGAGKSTVSRRLAERLGFHYLDTGAMYRAVTWAALDCGAEISNQEAVAAIAANIDIQFDDDRVIVDGNDVTEEIRSSAVTGAVSEIADNPEVREHMVMLQREIAATGNFVCEGRDQGTVAFPNADCKIFLTASADERAKRRYFQMLDSGLVADLDEILRNQQERDRRDKARPVGKLVKAENAIEVLTDGKTFDDVVDELESIVLTKIDANQARDLK